MRTPLTMGKCRLLVVVALIAGLVTGQFHARSTNAATDLEAGQSAVIADAQGDPVRLRDEPGLDGAVIDQFPEGTEAHIVDGLFEAADGSLWYQVEIDGESGFMISDYLSSTGDGVSSGVATVTSDLNLREGPSTSDGVLLVMPEGATVSVTGASSNGFLPVTYKGTDGWAYSEYLSTGGAVEGGSSPEGNATTTSDLNLRDGPSTSDDVIQVMPPGAEVTLTGGAENGFYSVEYRGTEGWAFAEFLMTGDDGGSSAGGEAVVTSSLNLREGPSTNDDVIDVMPAGAAVSVNGGTDNGFYPVTYRGTDGWAHGDYLDFDGGSAVVESDIIWPVSGGEWKISQGYNGFSHYNGGGGYQYAYSFDLARTDGGSAWQPVYSPVTGTVRWTEQASGGITIDLGNGYAVALFHLTVEGWEAGDRISQGDYLGTISGPGGAGYVDNFAHVHLTAWETTDGGNWSRIAVPFTGSNGISGQEFAASGSYSEWAGTVFSP